MKLIISLILLSLLGCSNNHNAPKIIKNNYKTVESSQVGMGRSVNIISFTSSYDNEKTLEKNLGKSLITMAQNEFSNSDFRVVERSNFDDTVKEHIFSKEVTNYPLNSNFTPARYNVYLRIVNMNISGKGIWIPILYTDTDYIMEMSIDIKIVNNETGESHTKNGKSIISKNENNFLLIFGDLGVNLNDVLEYSVRNAIRECISKFKGANL